MKYPCTWTRFEKSHAHLCMSLCRRRPLSGVQWHCPITMPPVWCSSQRWVVCRPTCTQNPVQLYSIPYLCAEQQQTTVCVTTDLYIHPSFRYKIQRSSIVAAFPAPGSTRNPPVPCGCCAAWFSYMECVRFSTSHLISFTRQEIGICCTKNAN